MTAPAREVVLWRAHPAYFDWTAKPRHDVERWPCQAEYVALPRAAHDEREALLVKMSEAPCELGCYWGGEPWQIRAQDCVEASVEMPKFDAEGDYSQAAWCWPCRARAVLKEKPHDPR